MALYMWLAVPVLLVLAAKQIFYYLTPPARRMNRAVPSIPALVRKPDGVVQKTNPNLIVVVGGCGFLGRNVAEQLKKRGNEVVVFDIIKGNLPGVKYVAGSILDVELLVETFQSAVGVIHCASLVQFVNYPMMVEVNVVGTQNVINACIRAGVKSLVYTSSISVAANGDVPMIGLDESAPPLVAHNNPYGKTKAAAEKLILQANGISGLKTCALRPPGLFGPLDPILTQGVAEGNPCIGDKNVQDWLYIENAAHFHVCAIDRLIENDEKVAGNFFYVNDGRMPYREFIDKIADAIDMPEKTAGSRKVLNQYLWILISCIIQFIYWVGGGYFSGKTYQLTLPVVQLARQDVWFLNTRAVRDLKYKPLYSMDAAIKKTGLAFKEKLSKK